MEWNKERALEFLDRQGYRPVDGVFLLAKEETPGLRCWGALDYLRHHQGFRVERSTN